MDRAQREAAQAGPLAEQIATQKVVVEKTKVAQLEADRTEQQLQAEVRKPADAEAYRQRTLAQADRDSRISRAEAAAKETELAAVAAAERTKIEAAATAEKVRVEAEAQAGSVEAVGRAEGEARRARGLAEADSLRAQGLANADAVKARADALAVNQDAVIAQQLAEKAVEIVGAAAYPLGEIDNLVVFNGTDGVQDAVLQTLGKGFAALQALRASLNVPVNGNGSGGSPGSSPSTQNGSEPAPDGVTAIAAPGREG
jgi:flotillin